MTSEHKQWENIKENYLKLVQKNLAQVDHPQRTEILANVREHLDNKYTELFPEQKSWEGYQQIITEMGPPEEYAELLTEEKMPAVTNKFGINEFLAIVFVVVLIVIGGYLIYTAKEAPTPKIAKKTFEFESDERVLGKWGTVDFVKMIDDFDPKKKNWQGELFLLSLEFKDNGKIHWEAKDRKKMMLEWTKGKVEPLDKRPSFYYLRNINGHQFLFYEWVSGDVTERGREPAYYVLKRISGNETVIPSWFETDPQAIGYWVSVDFVETIEDFHPEQQQTAELFLKTLHFEDTGKLWWTVGQSKPIALDWKNGKIRPFGIWPASYLIKPIDSINYLFYEYRTKQHQIAGYYVFKQTIESEVVEEEEDVAFQEDPQVLGQWTSVDFVRTPDAFQPEQKAWQGKLFVKNLHFKEQGIVEWCIGDDEMKINHRWTNGILDPDDSLPSRYIIERYENGDYLFMEWNSGDVSIRGQKPAYYVLKKVE